MASAINHGVIGPQLVALNMQIMSMYANQIPRWCG